MPSIRSAALAAALALTGLTALGCNRPNLDATGGGYEAGATADAVADTGRILPHDGPTPIDGPGMHGDAIEGGAADTTGGGTTDTAAAH